MLVAFDKTDHEVSQNAAKNVFRPNVCDRENRHNQMCIPHEKFIYTIKQNAVCKCFWWVWGFKNAIMFVKRMT